MRLLIVDDHEVVRRGVRSLLSQELGWDVCGEAIDGLDAIEKARELKPDVIVMDVSMPRLNGLEATRQLRSMIPSCEVLMLSQHENNEMARQALNAGARGYVVKSSISRDLITAILKVSEGKYFFDTAILNQTSPTHTDVQEILQRSAAFQKALRDNEELYRSTFDLTPVGIAHLSAEGRWLRVNRKLCEIVGYTEPELLRLTFHDITHPDDLPADLAHVEKIKKRELTTYSMEKRYIRKDGSLVWGNLSVSAVWDENSRFQHFIAVVEDISAKKSAQDALRESEARLQLAQQVANVGTFEWNIKTGVNCWTPELERMYGLPPGGFAGTQSAWEELVHPEDREIAVHAVERALKEQNGAFEAEWRVIWADGSVHWLLGRAWVLRDKDGSPDRLIGVNVDVTERKRVEDALEDSQKQLVLALQSSKTAMFDWDVIQRRGAWNPQMAAIYGFEPKDKYITAEEWMELFHPDDRERLAQEAEKYWLEGDEFRFEFRTVPRDGHCKWVTSHGRIMRDADGKAVRMIGIHADVTDRKRAEQGLLESQAELNEAQRLARIGSWHWNPASDRVTWSDELYRIAGRDPKSPAISYKDHHTLYTPESWERLQAVVSEALKNGTPYTVELEMIRSHGEKRWVIASGEAQRDSTGFVTALRGTVQDITDRKRMEDELRETEERTRFSLEAANIGTWEWDVTTGRVRWSRNMESVHGQKPGSFGESFDSFLEGVFVEDRDKVKEAIKLALSGKGVYHNEYRQYRSDGTLGWMEAHGRAIFDADGKPLRMFGVCANTTERRNAQDANGLLAAIVASSDDAIVSKTLAGIITSWNAGAERIFGYTAKETIGQHITLIIPRERRAEEDDILARLRRGEKIDHFQTVRRHKDGTLIDVSVTISPVRDSSGRVIGASKVARDITAQKRAEKALRESEQRYQIVTDASPIMIWMSGTDKLCYYFNKGWLDFVGHTLEEEVGNGWAAGVHPDDFDRCLQIYESNFDARRSFKMEYRLRHHSGQYRWILDHGVPRYKPDGTFEGYVGGCLDIHDQKEAAEKIRIADDSMRLMRVQDEERRRIAREFHDSAGQTLTVLGLSLAQLVQNAEVIAPGLAKQGKDIEEVVQQLHREIRTTSYLLHPPLLDEAGLKSALNWYVQGIVERSGTTIDLSIADDFGRLPADMELAVFRVVQECLTNIHRHAESKTAYVRVARENGTVCIEVKDEGKGISPERLAEIRSRGSGVGISGMRERLRHFGGELNIENTGSGTCVIARIPLPKEIAATEIEASEAAV